MLILSTPNTRKYLRPMLQLFKKLSKYRSNKINPYHIRREYDLIELIKLLIINGYKILKIIGITIPILVRKSKYSKLMSLCIAYILPFLASDAMIWAKVRS